MVGLYHKFHKQLFYTMNGNIDEYSIIITMPQLQPRQNVVDSILRKMPQLQPLQNVVTVPTAPVIASATNTTITLVDRVDRAKDSIIITMPQLQPLQNVVTIPARSVIASATNTTTLVDGVDRAEDANAIDLQSRYGRFGWPEAPTDLYYGIPYILRDSTKFFAVQMILTNRSVRTYLSRLHQDVYNYYFKVIKYATDAECRLFNEINHKHCDSMFGTGKYTTESLALIRDTDAYELWNFLDTCYGTLNSIPRVTPTKIGFLQFSFDSSTYVPYVMRNNEQYMPLCCFSNVNNVPIDYISGWDLAYLRFCCMYQGIWGTKSPEIYPVVTVSSMRANLPAGTNFSTCWPLLTEHNLLRKVAVAVRKSTHGSKQTAGQPNGQDAVVKRGKFVAVTTKGPGPEIPQRGAKKRGGGLVVGKPSSKVRRLENCECNTNIQGIVANK